MANLSKQLPFIPLRSSENHRGNRSELIRGGLEVNHQLEWKLIRLNLFNIRSEI